MKCFKLCNAIPTKQWKVLITKTKMCLNLTVLWYEDPAAGLLDTSRLYLWCHLRTRQPRHSHGECRNWYATLCSIGRRPHWKDFVSWHCTNAATWQVSGGYKTCVLSWLVCMLLQYYVLNIQMWPFLLFWFFLIHLDGVWETIYSGRNW